MFPKNHLRAGIFPRYSARLMDLLSEIEDYRARASQAGAPIAETTFGLKVLKDGKLIGRLRANPNGITLRTIEKVRQWMRDNPPPSKRDAA